MMKGLEGPGLGFLLGQPRGALSPWFRPFSQPDLRAPAPLALPRTRWPPGGDHGVLRACCFGLWFSPRTLWVLEGSCLKGRGVSSLAKTAQVVTRDATRSERMNDVTGLLPFLGSRSSAWSARGKERRTPLRAGIRGLSGDTSRSLGGISEPQRWSSSSLAARPVPTNRCCEPVVRDP